VSQQTPPPSPRRLRKSLLIIGIALLVSSFCLFYLASQIDNDHSTTYQDTVDLSQSAGSYHYDFGTSHDLSVKPYAIVMQPHDYLTVNYYTTTNGTVYIVLWDETGADANNYKVLKHSDITDPIALSFTNDHPYEMLVKVYLASQNQQNIIPTTTTLHHYDRPQWVLFSVAVVLISLGAISVFKSKR